MNHDLYGKLSALAAGIDSSEQLMVPFLSKKASGYVASMPHDQAIGKLSITLSAMVSNGKFFISRAEFRDMVSKAHVNGTKASDLFKDELNLKEKVSSVKYAEPVGEYVSVPVGDSFLNSALEDVFNGVEVREYSGEVAGRALNSVAATLGIWGLKPGRLEIAAGNKNYLVVRADYDTPKGITSVFVPVETSGSNFIDASVFVGNCEPQDLNNLNLKNYIKVNAGAKLSLSGEALLQVLGSLKSSVKEISATEMALVRLKSKRGSNTEFAADGITGLSVDPVGELDVQEQKFNGFEKFEEKFASTYGDAVLQFGSDKVKLSRDILYKSVVRLGHGNPQLKLSKISGNSISYAVSLGSVAFTTSLKIEGGLVHSPSVLISNGSVHAFNAENIKKLYTSAVDYNAKAVASPLYDLKPSELISLVRSAVLERNLQKAEDTLNVLAASGNEVAYATAFTIYKESLGNVEVKKTSCSHIVKSAAHHGGVCGHTGLSLDKVYQDKHGNCRPLYRQAMDDTFEGFLSMDSKVFLT